MSTQPLPEPPVRFYKIIAISFLLLTVILLGVVVFITSKTATITIIAKQDTEPVVLSVAVSSAGAADSLHGKVTSAQFGYASHYEPTGNKKVVGTSKGTIIIYNKSNSAQPLVKTTRFITASGTLFRLSEGVTVPANGQVTADVYADKTGGEYDIPPSQFTIPGLNTERQKEVYAVSKETMAGGEHTVGVLTSDDVTRAEDDYKQKLKDAYNATLASLSDGMVRLIEIGDMVEKVDKTVGQEVSGYTVSGTSTVTVVEYSASELSNLLARQVESKVDTSAEKFLTLSESPSVTVSSVNEKDGTAQLSVRQEVGVTLDANVPRLSPDHFFGKNKDDISRYVLGLDHVQDVQVQFSPSWVFTAPTVADRIHIIVKNM